MSMTVRILYFASLREALGCDQEALELPAGVHTVADLRRWLGTRGGIWAERFAPGLAVRCAVDQTMAGDDAVLAPGAEIAFFPPVTGG